MIAGFGVGLGSKAPFLDLFVIGAFDVSNVENKIIKGCIGGENALSFEVLSLSDGHDGDVSLKFFF